jgi:hypothetical protein
MLQTYGDNTLIESDRQIRNLRNGRSTNSVNKNYLDCHGRTHSLSRTGASRAQGKKDWTRRLLDHTMVERPNAREKRETNRVVLADVFWLYHTLPRFSELVRYKFGNVT